jgi:hypothetical protein
MYNSDHCVKSGALGSACSIDVSLIRQDTFLRRLSHGITMIGRYMEGLPSPNVTGDSGCVQRKPSSAFRRQRVHEGLIQRYILLHRRSWRSVEANLTAAQIELSDGWLSGAADIIRLRLAGMKVLGGGPHQSKTMMLAELSTLLSLGEQDNAVDAIVHRNLLGKPSMIALASWLQGAATHSAPAISRVALTGSFKTLHNADRFASRGRLQSVSQK